MAIGKRIVERLNALQQGRQYLFDKLPELTPQALSNLINRDSRRSEWDERIADALGVSVMWLVYGKNDEYHLAPAVTRIEAREPSSGESENNKEICRIMRQLNEQRQAEVIAFAQERLVLQSAGPQDSTWRAG